jgi:hypothetical protein
LTLGDNCQNRYDANGECGYGSYGVSVFRINDESKKPAPQFNRVWFGIGIVGIVCAIHGFVVAFVGYLSSERSWALRFIAKGMMTLITGWAMTFFGLYNWFSGRMP